VNQLASLAVETIARDGAAMTDDAFDQLSELPP